LRELAYIDGEFRRRVVATRLGESAHRISSRVPCNVEQGWR
jgi:hypothetical protein